MNSYWDLYVAYVHHCVEWNEKHDIDPHHYEMEWNHFLPRCIFEDQPIGHYLLLRQHAIASALQTLAFKENCMCAWHKKHLPDVLLNLAWVYYRGAASKRSKKYHSLEIKEGKSVHAIRMVEKVHSKKDENGKSLHSVKIGQNNANRKKGICNPDVHKLPHVINSKRNNGKKVGENFMKESKGIFDPDFKEKIHEAQVKSGQKAVENKTGIHEPVKWMSTVDGFISNVGNVVKHNSRNGWDPDARVRIS